MTQTAIVQEAERRKPDAPYIAPQVLPDLVGTTDTMRDLAALVRRCAPLDVSVLIRGDSGTGKELVARAVHTLSGRLGDFVALNGATLCDTLGSSALFGHVRGAYTGASLARPGAFRSAHRGTLFIDEVAALSPRLQAQLLRAVEQQRVAPVGSDVECRVDTRIITATCEPIEAHVARGTFRADLYQRLNTCILRLPPLRERLADVPHLIRSFSHEPPLSSVQLTRGARTILGCYDYPGNVRELRNVLVQAALSCTNGVIDAKDIRHVLQLRDGAATRRLTPDRAASLVTLAHGNVSAAARIAGVPRSTFRDALSRASGRSDRSASDAPKGHGITLSKVVIQRA